MDLERTFSRKIIFVPGLACFVFPGLVIAVGVFKMAYHILRYLRSMPLPIFLNHITNISLYLLPIEEYSKASSFLPLVGSDEVSIKRRKWSDSRK